MGTVCKDDTSEREERADDDSSECAGDFLKKSQEVGEGAHFDAMWKT